MNPFAVLVHILGRENGEDCNADFNCMFETWEAAVRWSVEKRVQGLENVKPIDIAAFLGVGKIAVD